MKYNLNIILCCSALLITLVSCEEGEHSMQSQIRTSDDYRSEFVGAYGGARTCSSSEPNDTLWNGIISISKDTLQVLNHATSTDSIWIDNWLIPISENGYFSTNNEVPGVSFFSAKFHHDTLKVQAFNYGPAGSSGCTWKTVRLK